MNRLLLALSPLLLSAVALAQPVSIDELDALEGTADEPQIRRYQVEVIIFAYAEDVGSGNEVFLPEPLFDETELLSEDDAEGAQAESVRDAAPDQTEDAPVRFEFELIGNEALTLTETREMLERLQAYEPLMHFGWIQGMYPDAETPVLPVARFAAPPPGLDGTLHLYLSRYLHLVVDLSLAAEDAAPSADPAAVEYRDRRYGSDRAWDEPQYAPLAYRILEDRILKNGETRYYDHPKFGVIAKVTRIEAEELEPEPNADSVAVR